MDSAVSPTSFVSLSNRLVTPRLRFRIIRFFWNLFFSHAQVSLLLFLQPAKVCIRESHLRRWSCVEWTCFKIHPATGFPRSSRHPQTCRCNRTSCGSGTCRNKIGRHIHYWSRIGYNPFSFFLFLFFSIVVQLIKLKFLEQRRELKWLILNKWRRYSTHHAWNSLWSRCLRDGVWSQWNGFGFLGPITNPEQLCGSVTHVSLWDFYLW